MKITRSALTVSAALSLLGMLSLAACSNNNGQGFDGGFPDSDNADNWRTYDSQNDSPEASADTGADAAAGAAGTAGAAGSDASPGGSGGEAGTGGAGGATGGTGGAGGAGGTLGPGGAGGSGGGSDLHGKVVDMWLLPLAYMPVVVNGTSVVTATDGTFVVPSAANTYDALVVDSNSYAAYVFKGLSRRDPTLQLFEYSSSSPSQVQLHGNMTGGHIPLGYDSDYGVVFGSPKGSCPWDYHDSTGDDTYACSVNISGATAASGNVYGLQWMIGEGDPLPQSYVGYASAPVDLVASDGGGMSQDLALSALSTPDSYDFSGNITLPDGYTVQNGRYLDINFDDYSSIEPVNDVTEMSTPTTPFTYKTPNISGAHVTFYFNARNSTTGQNVSTVMGGQPTTGVPDLEINVPVAPSLALPFDQATYVSTATTFLWSTFAGGIYVAQFYPYNSGDPTVYVVSSESSVTIPDLSSVGLPLPANDQYDWTVTAITPFASVDDACGTSGYQNTLSYLDHMSPTVKQVSYVANSAERSFWTGQGGGGGTVSRRKARTISTNLK